MPVRATKRGAQRTPIDRDVDVLVCGASFAGLAVARELRDAGASVLVLDRYDIGERQTSACAAPTEWLRNLGLEGAVQQTFGSLLVHTPRGDVRWPLPFTFSTFDYRTLCRLLWDQCDAEFDTAKVEGVERGAVHRVRTDRGEVRSPLVVDALGWRRVLGTVGGDVVQPPDALLSRGLEVHPDNRTPPAQDLELWLDPGYVPSGYSWSFPADSELRVGVGSFDPRYHVKDPTVRLAGDVGVPPVRFQGNWIPHALRPAVEDGVFFAGDSAGHCLPLTAEGIRTALYFGLACGRELRAVLAGARTREEALARYGAFSAAHARGFRWLLRFQRLAGRLIPTPVLHPVTRAVSQRRLVDGFFSRYLAIAPPEFALQGAPATAGARVPASV